MTIEPGFDLTEFHPVAMPFHHTVTSAKEDVIPVIPSHDYISRFVPRNTCMIDQECPAILLWEVPVALHDPTAAYTQLPLLPRRDLVPVFIHDFRLDMRAGCTDREGSLAL